jgi:hypothetical protein
MTNQKQGHHQIDHTNHETPERTLSCTQKTSPIWYNFFLFLSTRHVRVKTKYTFIPDILVY